MYCSTCGGAVAQGLTYCNHCGARLNGGDKGEGVNNPSELRAELLVSAVAGVFILGLAAIALLMWVTKVALGEPVAIVVTLLSFLLMLAVEGVLIGLLLRRTRGAKAADGGAARKGQTEKGLDAAQSRALPEGVPSVTEHTTRSFDPLYSERKSK